MSEENKAIVRRHLQEIWNQRNIAAVDEMFAPDFVNHDPARPDVKSLQEYKGWIASLHGAFPQYHTVEDHMFAEGDLVATRWTASVTVSDQFPIESTRGKKVLYTGINIHRLAGGKIQEVWWGYDQLGINQQLGRT